MRVVLVDCDLGGANLHSLLGMEYPKGTLSDFVLRRVALSPNWWFRRRWQASV